MVRAIGGDVATSVIDMVADAVDSAAVYVVESQAGREVLYGVSMFALRTADAAEEVLARFPTSPQFLRVTVGALRSAGFVVLPTGANVDHNDVQLAPGVVEGRMAAQPSGSGPSEVDLRTAAETVVRLAGRPWPNPAYAGGTSEG